MVNVTINGETFRIYKPRKYQAQKQYFEKYDGMDLYNYYERPSETKQAIWHSWDMWARDTAEVLTFGICSANGYRFNIAGTIVWNGVLYGINITATKNELVFIENLQSRWTHHGFNSRG